MSKHTPGPWTIEEWTGHNSHASFIGSITASNNVPIYSGPFSFHALHGADENEANANARLIAAAPDMYEALMAIKETIANSEYWWMDCPDRGGFDLEAIEAVIAKADGEA